MIFLWPAARFRAGALRRLGPAGAPAVEAGFKSLFPPAEPVFVSSARAGIALALEVAGAGRADLVGLPPYASHCLVEAVARRATPLAHGAQAAAAYRVVYHQWGHVQPRASSPAPVFDDACDTLCRPGAALFPAGGRFEFWSLPKIAGCSGGGVAWCRTADDAAALRRARDARRSGATLQWLMRRLGVYSTAAAEYWAGREASLGAPSRLACAEALEALERWERIVRAREERIDAVRRCWPAWLPQPADRLPCALPVRDEPAAHDVLRKLGSEIGVRHYERVDGLVKVLPLPLHEDVDVSALRAAAASLHAA